MPRIESFRSSTVRLITIVRTLPSWFVLVLAFGGFGLAAAGTFADDEFKIENSVYQGDSQPDPSAGADANASVDANNANPKAQEPESRSITYFTGGAVYDSIKQPGEIAVFDKAAKQFILVSITRRIRTELSTADIANLTLQLQKVAAKNADPLIRFSAEPSFQEQFDAATNALTLSSQWITYRLELTPEPSREAVE
jgi:hypothetical protein